MERHAEVSSEDISCKAKKQHWGGHKSKMRARDLMERARGETGKKLKFLKKEQNWRRTWDLLYASSEIVLLCTSPTFNFVLPF